MIRTVLQHTNPPRVHLQWSLHLLWISIAMTALAICHLEVLRYMSEGWMDRMATPPTTLGRILVIHCERERGTWLCRLRFEICKDDWAIVFTGLASLPTGLCLYLGQQAVDDQLDVNRRRDIRDADGSVCRETSSTQAIEQVFDLGETRRDTKAPIPVLSSRASLSDVKTFQNSESSFC
jgi:hypothetical protein